MYIESGDDISWESFCRRRAKEIKLEYAKFGFSMQSSIIRLCRILPKEAEVISYPVGLFGIIGKGERLGRDIRPGVQEI